MNATKTVSAVSIAGAYVLIDQAKAGVAGTTENVWRDLVTFAIEGLGPDNRNPETVMAYLEQTVEVEIVKAQAGKKSKPGAYRSAKSVINKAIANGVALFESDGVTVRGKSAVEKDCKEEATPEQKVERSLVAALKGLNEGGATMTGGIRDLIRDLAAKV